MQHNMTVETPKPPPSHPTPSDYIIIAKAPRSQPREAEEKVPGKLSGPADETPGQFFQAFIANKQISL